MGSLLVPAHLHIWLPVLGIVFQTAQTTNFTSAAILLVAFGIGHCSVIVGAGTLTKKVQQYLNWSEESKTILWIKSLWCFSHSGSVYLILTVA